VLTIPHYPTVSMVLCVLVVAVTITFRTVRGFFYAAISALVILLCLTKLVSGSLMNERNFFGVSRVFDAPSGDVRYLQHNTTIHGIQSMDAAHQLEATSYYAGLGEIMQHRLPSVRTQPIGAIGLGIGVVKCQTLPQQHMDIFEINPLVVNIAEDKNLFTYLSDCPGQHDIVLGDGRLTMSQMPHEKYGTIIIDAFSSDAIPVHLLTKEAFQMYLDKLQTGGIIAVHITNRYMDLRPLLAVQGKATGLVTYTKFFEGDGNLHYSAFWVVMARNEAALLPLLTETKDWWKVVPEEKLGLWTDDYTNILPYLTRIH
jgi:spermidine synthase